MFKKRSEITKKTNNSKERITSSDEDSNDSNVIVPMRNLARRFIIDDSSEEENTKPELSVKWDWKETDNTPIIWKYFESCGVKDYVLNQLGANHGLLDLFFIVFEENLWDILITQQIFTPIK